jgi:hypothetical protein
MKDANFAKVLDGNYDKKDKRTKETVFHKTIDERQKESDDFYQSLISIQTGGNDH